MRTLDQGHLGVHEPPEQREVASQRPLIVQQELQGAPERGSPDDRRPLLQHRRQASCPGSRGGRRRGPRPHATSLFALLITGVGALVVVYAGAYLSHASDTDRGRFFTLILLFMTAMLGAVLADNLLVLFLFWEATSILSFLLIGFHADSPHARRSALMSLRVTAGGGLALLAAILPIGVTLGSYSLSGATARADEMARSPSIGPILAGLLLGACTKSAQFPFHFWLPNAMQAPTPASAYLHSATMVKLGVYLLARFEPVIGAVAGGRDLVIAGALATMLVGGLQALRAENFKTVLAYSTVASLGILVMLVGLDGPMASVAMVGFILAHALVASGPGQRRWR